MSWILFSSFSIHHFLLVSYHTANHRVGTGPTTHTFAHKVISLTHCTFKLCFLFHDLTSYQNSAQTLKHGINNKFVPPYPDAPMRAFSHIFLLPSSIIPAQNIGPLSPHQMLKVALIHSRSFS
jgi:hypothetical protein